MTFGRWCVVVVEDFSEEVLEGDLLKVRTNKQRRHRPINWPLCTRVQVLRNWLDVGTCLSPPLNTRDEMSQYQKTLVQRTVPNMQLVPYLVDRRCREMQHQQC